MAHQLTSISWSDIEFDITEVSIFFAWFRSLTLWTSSSRSGFKSAPVRPPLDTLNFTGSHLVNEIQYKEGTWTLFLVVHSLLVYFLFIYAYWYLQYCKWAWWSPAQSLAPGLGAKKNHRKSLLRKFKVFEKWMDFQMPTCEPYEIHGLFL